ncbi:MAG TPA: tetratricopeptide repeat protein [Balneolaceae bacterium]
MKQDQSKIKQLARQIKANPGDSFSKFALALEFQKQGDFEKTRILFENILADDPDYIGTYYHLGKLYEMLDRSSDAQKLYKTGIKIASKQKEARTKSELQEALYQLEIDIEQEQKG